MSNIHNFEKFAGRTILIVDDIPDNLKTLAGFMAPLGLKVIPAMNGVHAINLAHAKMPDLILLDVMMPEMDGFEVCKKLKEDETTSGIPIIFLTGKTDSDDIIAGFEAGGSDYLTKPFNYKELLARVYVQLELKVATETILKQNKILEEQKLNLSDLNATKDKFFSIIAHDLRNPLGSFRSIAEYLSLNLSEMNFEEQKEFIDTIKDASKHVFELLENLLEWSRSQRGLLKYNPENHELNYLIHESVSSQELNAKNKNINIDVNVPDDLFVCVDAYLINTVIRNIVSNAIKFTKETGSINISAKVVDDKVNVSISDSGIGMDELGLKKLFRIDVNHSTLGTNEEKGTGLGLILCKEFIEKHDCKIWVNSEIGVGTTFTFELPLAK